MHAEVRAFEQWCLNAWGQSTRGSELLWAVGTPQIRHAWSFEDLSPALKAFLAKKLIVESCSQLGSIAATGDVHWFIHSFAREFPAGGLTWDLRRARPLKSSLMLVSYAHSYWSSDEIGQDLQAMTAGGDALAAMYVLAQLEYLWRVMSGYLDEDGELQTALPVSLRRSLDIPRNSTRVNRIDHAFRIYLYADIEPLAGDLCELDELVEIERRLQVLRNPVMHGQLPDPGVEAMFLSLLMAMFHYNPSQSERSQA